MVKVYYNLFNDLVEQQAGNIRLLDILLENKYDILTELGQLRGNKIDVAYITYNEQLILQLNDYQIKKMSVIVKGDDDIIIPKNFIKYSSDKMEALGGKCYNVVLNNKNYRTDTEIILIGNDCVYQDIVRNIYLIFGNVITSTMKKYNYDDLELQVKTRNLPNVGNIFFNVYMMLEGMKKCNIKNNIFKVRNDEHFSNLLPIINYLNDEEKIVTTNFALQKISQLKFSLSDHLIAGKYDNMFLMYATAYEILKNKITDLRKKLRLEYTPEQILTISYLKNTIDYNGAKDETYIKKIMTDNFHIIPVNELGTYKILNGEQVITNMKVILKETNKEIENQKKQHKEMISNYCLINDMNEL
jgi:hypothetical protein